MSVCGVIDPVPQTDSLSDTAVLCSALAAELIGGGITSAALLASSRVRAHRTDTPKQILQRSTHLFLLQRNIARIADVESEDGMDEVHELTEANSPGSIASRP